MTGAGDPTAAWYDNEIRRCMQDAVWTNSQAELRGYFELAFKSNKLDFDTFRVPGCPAKHFVRAYEINLVRSIKNQNVNSHL